VSDVDEQFCNYCHGARLVGWSGAGPILCPECSRGKDAFTVITQAWREQRNLANRLRAELAASNRERDKPGVPGTVDELRDMVREVTGNANALVHCLRSVGCQSVRVIWGGNDVQVQTYGADSATFAAAYAAVCALVKGGG
jgi:hypothetical protein